MVHFFSRMSSLFLFTTLSFSPTVLSASSSCSSSSLRCLVVRSVIVHHIIMAETLTPIVRWAQNGPRMDLTVELIDVKSPNIVLNETSLDFKGFGHGAHGENIYQFTLDFFSKIDYKNSDYKVTERNVSFRIIKQVKKEEWPRLLKNEKKPGWLKIDFDKLRLEDSEKEDDNENELDKINKISFEQRVKSDVEKAKYDFVIYSKVAWLTIYNLLQTVSFTIIFVKLLYRAFQHSKEVMLNMGKNPKVEVCGGLPNLSNDTVTLYLDQSDNT